MFIILPSCCNMTNSGSTMEMNTLAKMLGWTSIMLESAKEWDISSLEHPGYLHIAESHSVPYGNDVTDAPDFGTGDTELDSKIITTTTPNLPQPPASPPVQRRRIRVIDDEPDSSPSPSPSVPVQVQVQVQQPFSTNTPPSDDSIKPRRRKLKPISAVSARKGKGKGASKAKVRNRRVIDDDSSSSASEASEGEDAYSNTPLSSLSTPVTPVEVHVQDTYNTIASDVEYYEDPVWSPGLGQASTPFEAHLMAINDNDKDNDVNNESSVDAEEDAEDAGYDTDSFIDDDLDLEQEVEGEYEYEGDVESESESEQGEPSAESLIGNLEALTISTSTTPVTKPPHNHNHNHSHNKGISGSMNMTAAQFARKREFYSAILYKEFNKSVFGDQLPHDMEITWNVRLLTTGGYCKTKRSWDKEKKEWRMQCSIDLSTKVLDSYDRLRSTLIHEMCHAAVRLIDGNTSDVHGPRFKRWGRRVSRVYSDLTVSRCHNFKIQKKYEYKCTNSWCGQIYGRHSKSIDTTRKVCGRCQSKLELLHRVTKDGTPASIRAPNQYSLFVKENFARVKSENPGCGMGEVMKKIGAEWKERNGNAKKEKEKENESPTDGVDMMRGLFSSIEVENELKFEGEDQGVNMALEDSENQNYRNAIV